MGLERHGDETFARSAQIEQAEKLILMKIPLIANAHLDPVWLWDWREGLNEGIQTCRTVLDLMDEYPISPLSGARPLSMSTSSSSRPRSCTHHGDDRGGAWDVSCCTYIQPDTNLTGEATLRRHFVGAGYFDSHLGVRPGRLGRRLFRSQRRTAEHPRRCGNDWFCVHAPYSWDHELPGPPFWWEGDEDAACSPTAEVGVYLTERTGLTERSWMPAWKRRGGK
jgi:alpha-mannosidase